jgi:putative tricarboxylic transport membrane protein
MGVGILFLIGSLREGLFRKGIPGPGFLPFFMAISLIILSLIVFLPSLSRKQEAGTEPGLKFFPEADSFKKILLGLVALFAYGFALEHTGYLVTTFVFMLFTSRLMERKKWTGPFLMALLTAALSYALFTALEVQLPKGIWGL